MAWQEHTAIQRRLPSGKPKDSLKSFRFVQNHSASSG